MIDSSSKKLNQSLDDCEKELFQEGTEYLIEANNSITKDSVVNEEEDIIKSPSCNDIPERIINEGLSTVEEVEWLTEKLIKENPSIIMDETIIKTKITDIIRLNKESHLDAPYIATYMKHLYHPDLSLDQIYEIFSYEKEYKELMQYKTFIINQFKLIEVYLKDYPIDFQEEYIVKANSLHELDDIRAFLHFIKESHMRDHKNEPLQKLFSSEVKSIHPSIIVQLTKSKMNEFVSAFALPIEKVAFNLELLLNRTTTTTSNEDLLQLSPEPHETPAILSSKYLNNTLNEELKVLTQGCKYLAIQLNSHPFIRRYVMQYYYKHAVLSTQPTQKGKELITEDQPSFRVKYIKEKPIDSFNDTDIYLDIFDNEKKELITVSIEIKDNEEEYTELASKLLQSLYPNKKSTNEVLAKAWNLMREESLRMLIREVLLSSFKTKVRSELKAKAEEYVIKHCAKKFNQIIMTSPFNKEDKEEYPVVFALTYEASESKVYAVIIDSKGEVKETQCFFYISLKLIGLKKEEKAKYHQEISQCTSLIDTYQPSVIVIGANDLLCRYLKDQISTITSVPVEFKDISIGKLYSESKYANEVIDQAKIDQAYFQAIGIGKMIQSPLETIISIWEDKDYDNNYCLRIPFHPLQRLVNKAQLEHAFRTELIKAINIVGMDNSNTTYPLLNKKKLLFICGLSSRMIHKLNDVKNREELKLKMIEMKTIVYNCNGFIRFSSSKHILDKTRITLDMYPIAQKVLGILLKKKINKDFSSITSIEDIKSKLEQVDIDDFLANNNCLSDMKLDEEKNFIERLIREMCYPFKTDFIPYKSLTNKEVTQLLINDINFNEGIITTAKVIRFEDSYIKCLLFNGLDASIPFDETSDDSSSNSLEDIKQRFKDVILLRARVKEINWETQKAILTIKPSILLNHKDYLTQIVDKDHFDFLNEDLQSVDILNTNNANQSKFNALPGEKKLIARKIPNEKFKNFTLNQTIECLFMKNIGEFIFRPCYLGEDYLTLTYKVENQNVLIHYDIKQDKSTLLYHLFEYSYTDLKEIIDKYIIPCNSLFTSARSNRKYVSIESYSDFERKLKLEKTLKANLIHYFFTILKEFPGYVILGYTPKMSSVIIEYIRVSPSGYEFHNQKFLSIDDIIDHLKRHYGSDEYTEYLRRVKPPVVDYTRNCERDYKKIEGLDLVEGNVYANRVFKPASICKYCKEEGHMISECSKIKDKDNNKGGFTRNKRQRSDEVQDEGNMGWRSNNNMDDTNSNEIVGWGTVSDNKNFSNTVMDNKMVIDQPGWGNNTESSNTNINNEVIGWGSQQGNETKNEIIEVFKTNPVQGWGESNAVNNNSTLTSVWGSTDKKEIFTTNNTNTNTTQGWGNSPQQETQGWSKEEKVTETTTATTQGWGISTQQEIKVESTNQGWGNTTQNDTTQSAWGSNTNQQWGETSKDTNSNTSNQWNNKSSDRNTSWGESRPQRNNNNNRQRDGNDRNKQWENKPRYNNNNQRNNNSNWGNNNDQSNSAWNSSKQEDTKSNWGNQNNNQENTQQGWGSSNENHKTETVLGNKTKESTNQGWGNNTTSSNQEEKKAESSWDKPQSNNQGWGSTTNTNESKQEDKKTEVGWGNTNNNTKQESLSTEHGWGTQNNVSNTNQSSTVTGWGSTPNETSNITSTWGNDNTTTQNNQSFNNFWGSSGNDSNWNTSNNNNNAGTSWGSSSNQYQSKGDGFKKPTRGCFNCGEEGHNSRDCPQPKKERKPMKCFNCNEEGHSSRDCPQPKKERSNKCFNCNEEGHNSRDCPQPQKERSNKCFNCNEEGHNSRDCPQPKKERQPLKCFNCGEEGHGSRNCTQPKKERQPLKCFNCGEEGHGSRNCTQPKKERQPLKCFNCGEEGHGSRNCTQPKKERSNKCYNCNEEGHNANECPQPRKERKKACFNCGSEDHMSFACPEPPKDRDSSRGRGGRGRGEGRGRGGRGGYSNTDSNTASWGNWDTGKDSNNNNTWGTSNANDSWTSPQTNDNKKENTQSGWETSINNTNDGGWSKSNTDNTKTKDQGWGTSSNANQGWSNPNDDTDKNKDQGWGTSNNSDNNSNNTQQGWGTNTYTTPSKTTEQGWDSSNNNNNAQVKNNDAKPNKSDWGETSTIPEQPKTTPIENKPKSSQSDEWGSTVYTPMTKSNDNTQQQQQKKNTNYNKDKDKDSNNSLEPGEFDPNAN